MTDSFGWGKWLTHHRKEVYSLPLKFLSEHQYFYNEHYGKLGIAVDDDNSQLDDYDEDRNFENAALISNAPMMLRFSMSCRPSLIQNDCLTL